MWEQQSKSAAVNRRHAGQPDGSRALAPDGWSRRLLPAQLRRDAVAGTSRLNEFGVNQSKHL